MREPKLHGPYPPRRPGGSPLWFVQWYDDDTGPRHSKQFTDELRAQLFLQEKVQRRPVDIQTILLQKLSFLEKASAAFLERDDEALLSVEAENTRLRDKLAALEKQLRTEETRRNEKAPSAKSSGQSINFRAAGWAYEQEGLSVTAKAVLVSFAIHSNQHGYSWPGADRIASTWGMDRETVRRQIRDLLAKRKIFRTKKRRGATGQVKVYRLPKITYERGGKSHPFENDKSEGKARDKRRTSGGKSSTNKGTRNKESIAVADESFQLAVMKAATTATDFVDLINKLQLLFPDHTVACEYERFSKFREKRGLPKVASKFAVWMLRAEKPIKQPAVAAATPEFSNWFARAYPEKTSSPAWTEAPDWLKDEFRRWKKTGAMPTPAQA